MMEFSLKRLGFSVVAGMLAVAALATVVEVEVAQPCGDARRPRGHARGA